MPKKLILVHVFCTSYSTYLTSNQAHNQPLPEKSGGASTPENEKWELLTQAEPSFRGAAGLTSQCGALEGLSHLFLQVGACTLPLA